MIARIWHQRPLKALDDTLSPLWPIGGRHICSQKCSALSFASFYHLAQAHKYLPSFALRLCSS